MKVKLLSNSVRSPATVRNFGLVWGGAMCEDTAARILFGMNLPTFTDGNKGSGEGNSFLCAPVAEKNGTCSANTKSRC